MTRLLRLARWRSGTGVNVFGGLSQRGVVTKTSTGIVGLEVDVNARANFIAQSEQILEALKDIPETSAYRQDVEKIIKFRLNTAMKFEDEEMIEDEIGQGQLEELLEHGEDELKVIKMYIDEKMWEQVEGQEFTDSSVFQLPHNTPESVKEASK